MINLSYLININISLNVMRFINVTLSFISFSLLQYLFFIFIFAFYLCRVHVLFIFLSFLPLLFFSFLFLVLSLSLSLFFFFLLARYQNCTICKYYVKHRDKHRGINYIAQTIFLSSSPPEPFPLGCKSRQKVSCQVCAQPDEVIKVFLILR